MSWATLAKKAQDIEFDAAAPPKQVVVAPIPDADPTEEEKGPRHKIDSTNSQRLTASDLPSYTKGMLVLDANAFIKGLEDYISVADSLITTPQVMGEIRDRASREQLERLPVQLTIMDPTTESIARVMQMAEKTGDLGAMSRTDLRLCALALDCCDATGFVGDEIVPCAPQINPRAIKDQKDEIKEVTDEVSSSSESEDEVIEETVEEEKEKLAVKDDDGWITPGNITKVKEASTGSNKKFDGGCAAVTSDFPMQNTLLHLGVPIVGPKGMRITQLRLWLLRCHACFGIVHDTTRQFCPDCGSGDTLRRVSYVVNEKGEKKLFINFRRKISLRGTKYNLPAPRGGQHGTNRGLVLREDQLAHVIKGSKAIVQKTKVVMQEDDDLAMFGDPTKKKRFDISQPKDHSSYSKSNNNERKKMLASRRK